MGDNQEPFAKLAHDQWAGWMQYLFKFGTDNADGTFTIDADKVTRWKRQMGTPYECLPEQEKKSDRREAAKVWGILAQECILKGSKLRCDSQ